MMGKRSEIGALGYANTGCWACQRSEVASGTSRRDWLVADPHSRRRDPHSRLPIAEVSAALAVNFGELFDHYPTCIVYWRCRWFTSWTGQNRRRPRLPPTPCETPMASNTDARPSAPDSRPQTTRQLG